jgi:hypothetical protein
MDLLDCQSKHHVVAAAAAATPLSPSLAAAALAGDR